MEDLLIVILQALGQFLFELFAYLPWDWGWYWTPYDRRDTQSDGTFWAVVLSVGLGAAIGALSLFIFPDVLIKWGWLRIVLLFLSPLLSGSMALTMARWRQEQNKFIEPWTHFWLALCFSIGLVWVRFAFASRPH